MGNLKQSAAHAVNGQSEKVVSLISMPSNKRLDFFKGFAPQISMALPKDSDLNAARIVSLAVQLTSDSKIAQCEPKSIVGAIMQSIILGFEPIPGLGLAAWIPYGNKLHFQVEYKGYLDLLHRTGMYDAIYAEVVREGDEFKYCRGLRPDITHIPGDDNFDAPLTHAYAVAHIRNSTMPTFRVLPRAEVLQIRDNYSQAYRAKKTDSPWFGVRESEMWKKTAILQLQKDLPKSVTIQKAVALDEKSVSLDDINPETHEVNFAKYEMVNDTPAEMAKSEPEKPVTAKKEEKAPSTPPETPEPKTDPPTPASFGTEEEVEQAAKDNVGIDGPEDFGMVMCSCGEVYDPKEVQEMKEHLGHDTPAAMTVATEQQSDVRTLSEAFESVEANRKLKYIREEFKKAAERFAEIDIKNLGDFCQQYGIQALTGSDVTVDIYAQMKEDIKSIKK